MKLSSDMGLREAGEYAMDLKKAERWRSLFIYLFNGTFVREFLHEFTFFSNLTVFG